MAKTSFLIVAIGVFLSTCNQKGSTIKPIQPDNRGVINFKTEFYDSNGGPTLLMPMKIWYQDSVVIEEVVSVIRGTDTAGRTTVSYPLELYKYIDLRNKYWAEYKTFSDTAQITKGGVLPDSLLPGTGWTFYINNLPMKNEPKVLADTIFGRVKYMRFKFSRMNSRLPNSYGIGYLRYDNKGELFSLEKNFSKKVNCAMTRFDEYTKNALRPFASTEIEFLSDTLSRMELQVFKAWEQYAKANPVRN